MNSMIVTVVYLASMYFAAINALNTRPIIGVFAHPLSKNGQYIAASYVKWVESAGGRVVPIPYDSSFEYLDELLPQLNGILFPGGATNVNDRANYIYETALKINDQGTYYPVWGTCLGFEFLVQLTAQNESAIHGGFDSMNLSLPLIFNSEAPTSRLLSPAEGDIYSWLAGKPVTLNNHHQGITPDDFQQNPKLTEFYTILSTNFDRKGREFVSTIEAKKYPIYAVIFHPEKNNFEFGEYADGIPYEVIDHSYEGVRISQYFANFFISEARKNDLSFEDPVVKHKALIYNYKTSTFTAPGFVESYIFKHNFEVGFSEDEDEDKGLF